MLCFVALLETRLLLFQFQSCYKVITLFFYIRTYMGSHMCMTHTYIYTPATFTGTYVCVCAQAIENYSHEMKPE